MQFYIYFIQIFTKAISETKVDFNITEPFTNLFTQGMVCHKSFKDEKGNWLYPEEVILTDEKTYVKKSDGNKVIVGPPSLCQNQKKISILKL